MRKSPPRPSRRAAEGEPARLGAPERREAILAAALPLFARRGYAAAGTRDLAAAAGVTEPILYRHFPGKEALFLAVLERVEARLDAALGSTVEGVEGAGGRLRALAAALPSILADLAAELRVLLVAASVRESDAIGAAARDALTRLGETLTLAFRGTGLRRGVRPATAGHLLLQYGLGASLLRPLGVRAVLSPEYGDQAVRILTRALLP
jgi:AcrR family transcriptional regulator